MMELRDTAPRLAVREADYKRFLRYPPTRPLEGPMAENADWARAWYAEHGRPWWCARQIGSWERVDEGLRLDGENFHCPTLAERAARATTVWVVAVSAGREVDAEAQARWEADEPDRYYFLQSWGGAVVAALLEAARVRIAEHAGNQLDDVKLGYAPGYPDWPIDDMPRLLAVLQGGEPTPGPLEVLSSGMLVPKKSQLAVYFAGKRAEGCCT
jgi:hypothetical protein